MSDTITPLNRKARAVVFASKYLTIEKLEKIFVSIRNEALEQAARHVETNGGDAVEILGNQIRTLPQEPSCGQD